MQSEESGCLNHASVPAPKPVQAFVLPDRFPMPQFYLLYPTKGAYVPCDGVGSGTVQMINLLDLSVPRFGEWQCCQ